MSSRGPREPGAPGSLARPGGEEQEEEEFPAADPAAATLARPRSPAGSPVRPSRAPGPRVPRAAPLRAPPPPPRFGSLAAGGARRAEAAAALGREEADTGAERPRPGPPRAEMASYVDNSFRQAVMKNPAERTSQVRPGGTRPLRASEAAPAGTSSAQLQPVSQSLSPVSPGVLFRLLEGLLWLPSPFLTFPRRLPSGGNCLLSFPSPQPHARPRECWGAGGVGRGGSHLPGLAPLPLRPRAPSSSCMWPLRPFEFGGVCRGVCRGIAGNLSGSAGDDPCWPSYNVKH